MDGDTIYAIKTLLIVMLLVGIIIGGIAFGLSEVVEAVDNYTYNEGICRKCGGDYLFYQIVNARTIAYAYRCNKCGNIITLEAYR